ncbi:MAG: hypothetical protein KBT67_04000 [bacterium]|nr:hypothetical protein [Candidatus Limimorpha caballi]
MAKMFIGSKTLGSWFEDDEPEGWIVAQIIADLKQSVCDNAMLQAVTFDGEELKTLRKMNDASSWALRELTKLFNEVINEIQKGD